MNLRVLTTLVIAVATIVVAPLPTDAQQQLGSVTDPDAYAIYGGILPAVWASVSKETLLVQQETENIEAVSRCLASASAAADPEWDLVEADFKKANEQVRMLTRALPVAVPCRLIPRAEILADDARLALKYPGVWQRRPESMEYAAVSAVGFNPTKDKAIVYIRLRSKGDLYSRELRDGRWVVAKRNGCGWIA